MRPLLPAAAFLLFSVTAAMAAPTCLDKNLDTIRCGVPGAMPVGWKPTAQQRWDKDISKPAEYNLAEFAKVIIGMGLFFAMIALLPRFDGSRSEDWEPDQDNQKDQ